MARSDRWPVVRPLPVWLIKVGLAVFYVVGCALIWKDRRLTRVAVTAKKPIGLPAFK